MCHHGMRSLQVAHFLAQHGYVDVYNLSGGIDAWSAFIDPQVARY
jgi:rhodanese-related sulfurtransferase